MRQLFSLLSLIFFTSAAFAQAPLQFNFQGVARNAQGNAIVNKNITVRLSILNSASSRTKEYSETRNVTTNSVGLFNIVIGSTGASSLIGTMKAIDWSSGSKYLQLELDPLGGSNFLDLGITQFQSVPYALNAYTASPIGTASGDLTGAYPNPTIAANAITTNKIADATVTDAKIVTVSGMKITGDIPGNAANVTGVVAIANGGTGATTLEGVKTNLAINNVDNTSDANKPVSAAQQNALDTKLNISDTAAMLSPYATAAKSNEELNLKVNISDTASMLSPYARTQRMIDSLTAVRNSIALKLNIADTAAMLAPYATIAGSASGLNTKVNITDTASMLNPYARTQRMIDSLTLVQNRLDLKLNLADTAAMLNPYYLKSASVSELATKENVANKSTDIVTDAASDTKYPSVKTVKDYVDAASTGNSTALASEIANRINADDSIKNNLATETARATSAENTLIANLSAEVTNRINADDSIKNNLTTETARATAEEALLGTTKENTANKSTATALGTSDVLFPTQNAVKTYVDAASTGNSTALASEITNRINADDSIKNNLAAETARATNSENTLTTNLSAEVTNRINADDSIKNNLAAETARATAAEATKENTANKSTATALGTSDVLFPTQNAVKTYVDAASTGNSTALASEITNRINADDSIKNNLAAEITRAKDSENTLTINLSAEVTNRINADDSIKSNLTTETARAKAEETLLGTTKENTANKSTATALGASDVLFPTQNAVKTYVDAASTGSSTALATEITNRINADDSIKNSLSNEIARATSSENTLTTNLSAEVTNRINADDSIKNNLAAETARATAAEATKENTANKSTATALGTSDVLFPTQNAVKTYVDAASTGNSTALASEITNRINADDSIKNNLAAEITRAKDSENTLTINLSAEVTNRINADDSIKSNLTTETARAKAEETLLGTTKENTANKSTATALGASDVLFPTQNAVKTYVDAASTGSSTALATEITNRINADDSIKNSLSNEIARATSSENTLTTNLSAEVTNRINADDSIKNNLAAETARATAEETLLGTTKENTANKSTATALGTSDVLFPTQNAVKTYVDAASTGNSTALASEIINRINADDSIKNNLSNEIARATSSENALITDLSAEVTNRINADDSIKNNLSAEITRAKDSENTLTINLSAEVTNRTNADDSIKNNLATETARATAEETLLGTTKENTANKSTATALGTSDVLFPTQNAVKTYVDAASTGNSTALATEITNRINADDSIKNNLTTETARAISSENTLTTNLSAEVTNRTNADDSIKNNLATEIARATAEEATKENTANKSTATALGTSDVLFPTQNAVKTYVDAASSGNSTALASEIINRINADDSIKNNLSNEIARATSSENTLTTNLSAEVTNRINADDSIKNNLATEIARATAEEATKENTANKSTATALGTSDVLFPTQNAVKTYVDAASTGNSTALATEITNRINADDSIKNNLSNEIARATSSENALITNLSAEVTNRINADDSIKNNLAAEITRATAEETLLGTTKENTANKSTATALGTSDVLFPTQNAVKTYVDAASTGSSTALASEITNRINADDSIKNNLAAEITRAKDSENTLTTNLSAEVANRINAVDSIKNNLAAETARATGEETLLGTTKENTANKSTATALGASDVLFPTQNAVKTYVDAASTGNSNALATEIANRINADDSIKNNLSNEIARAKGAETTIANNLLTETANRAIAEATISTNVSSIGTSVFLLSGSLAAETTNRTAADATITANLNAETARATAEETLLRTTKENTANKSTATALGTSDVLFPTQNAVKTYVDAASTGSSTALASEITNRINADDSIKNNLAAEITRAKDSENTLTTNLSAEITNRINADDSIKNNLATEIARATAEEALLGTTKENTANKSTATTLGTSDVLFPTQNAVKTYVDAASTGSSTALASEITNRINADDSIKNNLAAEITRAKDSEATKVNIADTTLMLSPYARTQRMIDSLTLVQNRINLKVNIADTATMLAPYATVANSDAGLNLKVNISDTSTMLSTYARTQRMIDSLTLVQNRINLKVNIADTATMLAPYATVASSTSGLNTKVNISDTSTMLSPYARTQRMIDSLAAVRNTIALKLNITDTALMLSPYTRTQRMLDSLALVQNRLGSKLNIADTATMLSPYAKAANFVDLTTSQTIAGVKTFNSDMIIDKIRIGKGPGESAVYTVGNLVFGESALAYNTMGQNVLAIGSRALQNNTAGNYNLGIGIGALSTNLIGNENLAVGGAALAFTTGSYNTAVGVNALLLGGAISYSTSIGNQSGMFNTGSNNTFLGALTDQNTASALITNSTAIGYNAKVTAANQIQLGNSSVTSVNTSGDLTAKSFKMTGGTASQFLKADGSVDINTYLPLSGGIAANLVVTNLAVTNTIAGSITGNAATVTSGVYTTGSYGNPSWITDLAWSKLTGRPTTIAGYGITDFNSLGDARWSLTSHTHTFASLTSKPTTILGYGITDAFTQTLADARYKAVGYAPAYTDITGTTPTWNQNTTGSAATLTTGRTIAITGDVTYTSPSFNGSTNITAAATVTRINGTALSGLTTGILKNTTGTGVPSIAVAGTDYLTPTGSAANLTGFPTFNQSTTGNAATATKLATARAINGISFDGSADITVTAVADATTLTGNSLKSTVLASSLTSVGTLANLTVAGNTTASGSLTGGNSATSTIAGFAANINTQTATTYTLTATDNGKIITLNNASAITLTVPTLFAGFNCMIVQTGAGEVTISNGSGVTINNRSSNTKTAGTNAIATLIALSSTSFISSGDMK